MGRRGAFGLLGATALLGAVMACQPSSGVFTCSANADCTGEGNGVCVETGFCAFPDAMCESGLRYGALAGGGFAELCVPVDTTGSSGGIDPTTTNPPPDSSSSATTTSVDPTSGTDESTTTDPTSAESGSSTGPEPTSTTGDPADCMVVVDDDFEGETLPSHWDIVAPNDSLVAVATGELQLTPTGPTGDQPTWVRYTSRVGFKGVQLLANVSNFPPVDGVQAIVSLTRDNGNEAYDIVADEANADLIARAWDEAGAYVDLQTVPYDKGKAPWLRIREHAGTLYFEAGPSRETLTAFHEVAVDLSDWQGSLYVGADNYLTSDGSEDLQYDDVAICVVP